MKKIMRNEIMRVRLKLKMTLMKIKPIYSLLFRLSSQIRDKKTNIDNVEYKNYENFEYENENKSNENLTIPKKSNRKESPVTRYENPITHYIYVNYIKMQMYQTHLSRR